MLRKLNLFMLITTALMGQTFATGPVEEGIERVTGKRRHLVLPTKTGSASTAMVIEQDPTEEEGKIDQPATGSASTAMVIEQNPADNLIKSALKEFRKPLIVSNIAAAIRDAIFCSCYNSAIKNLKKAVKEHQSAQASFYLALCAVSKKTYPGTSVPIINSQLTLPYIMFALEHGMKPKALFTKFYEAYSTGNIIVPSNDTIATLFNGLVKSQSSSSPKIAEPETLKKILRKIFPGAKLWSDDETLTESVEDLTEAFSATFTLVDNVVHTVDGALMEEGIPKPSRRSQQRFSRATYVSAGSL